MKRDLAIRALNMAIAFRSPPKGCIHHTDRGSQYCSHDYQKILRQHGFKVSMSGKGNCYDNAAVETFFKTIKAELIWRDTWETRRKAEMAIFEYINGFYNPRRRTQHWAGKAPSLSKGKWLKRALGAALKRDRSNPANTHQRYCRTLAASGPFVQQSPTLRGALSNFYSASRYYFNAASVITCVHAPSGTAEITGSEPPDSNVATVRSKSATSNAPFEPAVSFEISPIMRI